MGEVRRVRERNLGQVLAMKISFQPASTDQRFLDEARAMAALRHPGVLAVHDHGVLPQGHRWFTTRLIDGETLHDAIGRVDARDVDSVRRLLHCLVLAGEAVGFAHRGGVFHRDLKPANILLSVHDEVVVADWGLTVLSLDVEGHSDALKEGEFLGTPGFMAPEQAAGDPGRDLARCDVFSLGMCLHAVLHGPPQGLPHDRSGCMQFFVELARRCTSTDPAERPENAQRFSDDLRRGLARQRQRRRALSRLKEARALQGEVSTLHERVMSLRERAKAHLQQVNPRTPTAEKAPGWRLEDEADALQVTLQAKEARYLQGLRAALTEDDACEEAHRLLAEHYRERMALAELQGRADAAAFSEVMCRTHDRSGRHKAWLDGDGALTLHTSPQGVWFDLARFEEVDRRLVPRPVGIIGPTPITGIRLPRGSYVATPRGNESTPILFSISRATTWSLIRPGEATPTEVPMDPEPGEGLCRVRAGWFEAGGDAEGADSLPRCTIWVDEFVVAQHPVTFGDYLCFVQSLDAQGLDVADLLPVERIGVSASPRPLIARGRNGSFALASGAARHLRPEFPVVQVTWHQACAYAAWLSGHTGKPWRLLHELEWEKAARGVDARTFPWGNFFDPTWACMLHSHEGPADSVSVHAFPTDTSPYGVRGLAGNVREWCINDYSRDAPPHHPLAVVAGRGSYRAIRGGAWSSAANFCRAAGRFAAAPEERLSSLGFRVGYSTSSVPRTGPDGSMVVR